MYFQNSAHWCQKPLDKIHELVYTICRLRRQKGCPARPRSRLNRRPTKPPFDELPRMEFVCPAPIQLHHYTGRFRCLRVQTFQPPSCCRRLFSRRWTPPSAINSAISGRQRHRFHTLSSPFSPLNSRRKSFVAVQRAMQFRPAKLHVSPTTSGMRIAGGTLRTRRSTFDRRAPFRQESCRSTART